jgi:hypothetical protein
VHNTSVDQIELMLDVALHELRSPEGAYIYNDWERKFLLDVNAAYDSKARRGFLDRPLSGKQLFWLQRLYERLAVVVTAHLLLQKDP